MMGTLRFVDGEPGSDVWTLSGVEVRRSLIAGDGLFAVEDIAQGDLVIRLGGRLASTSELDRLIAAADTEPDAAYVDTITVSDDVHLVLPPATMAHYANHSCDPNLWHAGPFDIVARRDICAGDELTVDYATSSGAPGFRMTCTCGSPSCRHEISSEDFSIVELQERYRGHWVPALQRRIDRP